MAEIQLSEKNLQNLLNKFGNSRDEQHLKLHVDEDEGLVEGNDASTWLSYQRYDDKTEDQIAWNMEDDDGECELESFPADIKGLKEALIKHSERQDVMGDQDYNKYLNDFLRNLKEQDLKPIAKKVIKEFKSTSIPLEGKELLEKIKELKESGDLSKAEIVKGCGYFVESEDGAQKMRFMEFYAAVAEAKEDN